MAWLKAGGKDTQLAAGVFCSVLEVAVTVVDERVRKPRLRVCKADDGNAPWHAVPDWRKGISFQTVLFKPELDNY